MAKNNKKEGKNKRFVFILEKRKDGEFDVELTNKLPVVELLTGLSITFTDDPNIKALFSDAILLADVVNQKHGTIGKEE